MAWLLLVILLFLPLGHLVRVEVTRGVAFYPQDLIAALVTLSVTVSAIRTRKFPEGRLLVPILTFVLVASVSLILGARWVETNQVVVGALYLLRWVAYAGIYMALAGYKTRTAASKMSIGRWQPREALLLSGLVLMVFALVQYLVLPDLRDLKWLGWDDHYYRAVGTILDPGFTGILAVLTLLMALGSRLSGPVRIVSLLVPSVTLLLTYSRASYVAFLVSVLVYTFLRKKTAFVPLTLLTFFISIILLPRPGGEGVNLLRRYSLVSRARNWNNALTIAEEHPLLGVGFNLYRFAQYRHGFLEENWEIAHGGAGAENSYLFILATTGGIGFLVFLWLLSEQLKLTLGKSGIRENPADAASLVAVSVHALFNNSWFYPWVMIWIWFLLGVVEMERKATRITAQR